MTPSRFGIDAPGRPAPAWHTQEWFNHAGGALQLADLHGQVVVLHAFQML